MKQTLFTFTSLNKSEKISETLKELPMSREYVGKTEDNSVVFELQFK